MACNAENETEKLKGYRCKEMYTTLKQMLRKAAVNNEEKTLQLKKVPIVEGVTK